MSILEIRTEGSSSNETATAPLSVEVLDTSMRIVREFSMQGSGAETVDLDPGDYLVRALLPSGLTVSDEVHLTPQGGHAAIPLRTEPSRHEWLDWQQFLGTDVGSMRELVDPHFDGLWMRLWIRERSGRWNPSPWPSPMSQSDRSMRWYEFAGVGHRLAFIQMGGPHVPARMIAFPPGQNHVNLFIQALEDDSGYQGGVAPHVSSDEPGQEALLRYASGGEHEAARVVGREVIARSSEIATLQAFPPDTAAGEAEAMLRDKLSDPAGAAVGAYHLLRTGELSRLHSWPRNFANWLSWMPDGHVVYAWQLIRGDEPSPADLTEAGRQLLSAERTGLPIYTEGLRLLNDGLRIFAARRRGATRFQAAVERLRPFLDATDWSSPYTTVYGADPTSPGFGALGIPEDRTHLAFVERYHSA